MTNSITEKIVPDLVKKIGQSKVSTILPQLHIICKQNWLDLNCKRQMDIATKIYLKSILFN